MDTTRRIPVGRLVAMALFSSAGGARGPGVQIGLCVGLNGACLAPRLSGSTPCPYSAVVRCKVDFEVLCFLGYPAHTPAKGDGARSIA